jgi:hypothetical protein
MGVFQHLFLGNSKGANFWFARRDSVIASTRRPTIAMVLFNVAATQSSCIPAAFDEAHRETINPPKP